jgi:hypothetical protein
VEGLSGPSKPTEKRHFIGSEEFPETLSFNISAVTDMINIGSVFSVT